MSAGQLAERPNLASFRRGRTGAGAPVVKNWIAAGLMALAAIVEVVLGVDAEQQSLEEIAPPLSETD